VDLRCLQGRSAADKIRQIENRNRDLLVFFRKNAHINYKASLE
jgi:hypothetical protein